MQGSVAERIGHNESVLRDVNERIKAGQWPSGDQPIAFRCECAMLRCTKLVELTLPEYEDVRSDPRWFLLVPGHEIAGVEVIVRRGANHIVVEKIGDAGREAEAQAP